MYMRWSLSRRVRQSTWGKLDAPGAFPGSPDARERSLTVAARNRAASVSERFFGSKDLFLGRKEIAADGKAKNKTGNVRIRLGAALGEYVVQAQRKFVAGGVTDRPYARNCLQPRFQLPAEDGGLGRGIPDAADAARDVGRHERGLRNRPRSHGRRVAQALHEKAGAGYQ